MIHDSGSEDLCKCVLGEVRTDEVAYTLETMALVSEFFSGKKNNLEENFMKINIYLLTFSAAVLTGCAHVPTTSLVSTSPRTVVVQSFAGVGGAQKMASSECQKHGREARYSSTIPGTIQYVFDCIQ